MRKPRFHIQLRKTPDGQYQLVEHSNRPKPNTITFQSFSRYPAREALKRAMVEHRIRGFDGTHRDGINREVVLDHGTTKAIRNSL